MFIFNSVRFYDYHVAIASIRDNAQFQRDETNFELSVDHFSHFGGLHTWLIARPPTDFQYKELNNSIDKSEDQIKQRKTMSN